MKSIKDLMNEELNKTQFFLIHILIILLALVAYMHEIIKVKESEIQQLEEAYRKVRGEKWSLNQQLYGVETVTPEYRLLDKVWNERESLQKEESK